MGRLPRVLLPLAGAVGGIAVATLAFIPFVDIYGYIPALPVLVFAVVAAPFLAFLGVAGLRRAPSRILQAGFLAAFVGVASIVGATYGVVALGGLAVFIPGAAAVAAVGVVFALRSPTGPSALRLTVLGLLNTSILLAPGLYFLSRVPGSLEPLLFRGLVATGFTAGLFGTLYALSMGALAIAMHRGPVPAASRSDVAAGPRESS